MNRKSYIVLHKTEWDRIKRCERTTNSNEREQYFYMLNEKSQEMIKNWHDSIQGHINKVEKQKKLKLAKDLKTIQEFNARKKLKNNDEVIKKAKKLIFQDSCYGRQLISALLESKVLEEVEAQIKFQNEIRKKTKTKLAPKATSLKLSCDNELNEKELEINKKRMEIEIAEINKEIYIKKRLDEKERRFKEKQQEREDERWMKQNIQNETKLQAEILQYQQKEIKEYIQEGEKIKGSRANFDKQEELLREVWRKYQDKIKLKEKAVFEKIHRNSSDTTKWANTYKIIERANCEKDKKYNDFIENGVTKYDKRLNEQDQENERKTKDRDKRKALDNENKLLLEFKNQIVLNTKIREEAQSHDDQFPIIKEKPKKTAERNVCPTFLVRNNKLLENQKEVKNAESSRTALNAVHKQFAQHASNILQESRYKHPALRVIDNYRRINYLNEKSLPILE